MTELTTTASVISNSPAGGTPLEPPRHDAFDPPARVRVPLKRLVPKRFGGGGGKGAARADSDDSGSFDLRNSWQVAVGSILIPMGVIIILIAWYGAAHARVVQQQIPYLVSGSFIGLGCMVVGGLLYFGHWLYRLYDQADLQHEEQLKVLEELVRTLTGETRLVTSAGDASPSAGMFLATASGTVYHQSGCPVIAHHPEDLRVLGPTELTRLRPCLICSRE